MVAMLRWVSILAGVGWMAVVCVGTAESADPLWALNTFRSVVPGGGVFPLAIFTAWSVVLPFMGMWSLVRTFARVCPYCVVIAAIVGVCVGILLNYLQFALPFAGGISDVPGLPAALMFYGNERLAGVWAVAFCVNLAFYGVLGSGIGLTLGGSWLGAGASRPPSHAHLGRNRTSVRAVNRIAGAVVLCASVLVVVFWRFGHGAEGIDALLAEFDVAPSVHFVSDVTYDRQDGVDLKLDMCRPTRSDARLPAVVCIHGGGWRGGTRSEYVPLIVQLARRGYVAVTIDYRLAPTHRFPAQAEDVRSAVRWVRQHADELGVDPDHIGLIGWSAGGHLACFVGVTGTSGESRINGSGKLVDVRPSAGVQAVVSFSGLTDFSADYWDVIPSGRRFLTGSELDPNPLTYRAASPVAYVTGDAPPFLLLHGVEDPVVPIDQSQRFRDALLVVGGTVSLREYDGQGHRWFGSRLRSANREAITFLDRQLRKAVGPLGTESTGNRSR